MAVSVANFSPHPSTLTLYENFSIWCIRRGSDASLEVQEDLPDLPATHKVGFVTTFTLSQDCAADGVNMLEDPNADAVLYHSTLG